MGGAQRGFTGKLIGVDGSDGIVKVDESLDVKILDMGILAKLVQSWCEQLVFWDSVNFVPWSTLYIFLARSID